MSKRCNIHYIALRPRFIDHAAQCSLNLVRSPEGIRFIKRNPRGLAREDLLKAFHALVDLRHCFLIVADQGVSHLRGGPQHGSNRGASFLVTSRAQKDVYWPAHSGGQRRHRDSVNMSDHHSLPSNRLSWGGSSNTL